LYVSEKNITSALCVTLRAIALAPHKLIVEAVEKPENSEKTSGNSKVKGIK
jgi:hypothetical protein